jgi:hypothetical protein
MIKSNCLRRAMMGYLGLVKNSARAYLPAYYMYRCAIDVPYLVMVIRLYEREGERAHIIEAHAARIKILYKYRHTGVQIRTYSHAQVLQSVSACAKCFRVEKIFLSDFLKLKLLLSRDANIRNVFTFQ